jgi:MFS family permease
VEVFFCLKNEDNIKGGSMQQENNLYEQQLKRNVILFYYFKISNGFFFFAPTIVLFWQSNGLSLTEVMLLQSVFSYGVVLMEIPSGFLADRTSRKNILIWGQITLALAVVVYGFSTSFYQFVFAETLFAMAIAMTSGADSALLYDTMKELGETDRYQQVYGKANYYWILILAFSSIIGGYISDFDLRWTFYFMTPFVSIAAIFILFMKEPKRSKLPRTHKYLHELIKIFKFVFFENKKLSWMMIYYAVVFCINQIIFWFYQPYLKISGIPIIYFGYIFAMIQLVAALFSKYSHQIENRFGAKKILILLPIMSAGSYLLLAAFPFWFGFVFIFLGQCVRAFLQVVVNDYINRLCPSAVRATVLSIQSMAGRLTYATIIPMAGYLADRDGLLSSFNTIGFTSMIVGVTLILLMFRSKTV